MSQYMANADDPPLIFPLPSGIGTTGFHISVISGDVYMQQEHSKVLVKSVNAGTMRLSLCPNCLLFRSCGIAFISVINVPAVQKTMSPPLLQVVFPSQTDLKSSIYSFAFGLKTSSTNSFAASAQPYEA
jgi:hypothetical protein